MHMHDCQANRITHVHTLCDHTCVASAYVMIVQCQVSSMCHATLEWLPHAILESDALYEHGTREFRIRSIGHLMITVSQTFSATYITHWLEDSCWAEAIKSSRRTAVHLLSCWNYCTRNLRAARSTDAELADITNRYVHSSLLTYKCTRCMYDVVIRNDSKDMGDASSTYHFHPISFAFKWPLLHMFSVAFLPALRPISFAFNLLATVALRLLRNFFNVRWYTNEYALFFSYAALDFADFITTARSLVAFLVLDFGHFTAAAGFFNTCPEMMVSFSYCMIGTTVSNHVDPNLAFMKPVDQSLDTSEHGTHPELLSFTNFDCFPSQ